MIENERTQHFVCGALGFFPRGIQSSDKQQVMDAPPPPSTHEESESLPSGESMAHLRQSQLSFFGPLSVVFGDIVPRQHVGLAFDGWPKMLELANSGFETGKALRTVVFILQYLKERSPETLVPATKILADGSRNG